MKEVKGYDDFGKLIYIKMYENGKITNLKSYDEDENLIIETPYKNGKKHGVENTIKRNANHDLCIL